MPSEDDDISWLLSEADREDPKIKERLWAALYPTLQEMAEREMRHSSLDESIQPGGLVGEAYMRMIRSSKVGWEGRAHFLGTAASIMRHILVDRARKRAADKRGGQRKRLTLEAAEAVAEDAHVDVQELDEALKQLAKRNARQARIVELRFFGGLDVEETAQHMHISPRTVKADWAEAKEYLRKQLGAE
jgi:RNA polymerase sigma-70 factor (ECF subfamily)